MSWVNRCAQCEKDCLGTFCEEECRTAFFAVRGEEGGRVALVTKKFGSPGRRKKKKKKGRRRDKRGFDGFSDNPFYRSPEWRRVRYLAIKKYGRRCMACGNEAKQAHVDHIKPRSKFPRLALCLTNLQILCQDCNLGKGAWDATDWRPKPDVTPPH